MQSLKLITFIWCISFCYAIRQQFGFYTEKNCTGDRLIIESKQADLTTLIPGFVLATQSLSFSGIWAIYDYINYVDGGIFLGPDTGVRCYTMSPNTSWNSTKSVRYLGPPDTATHSVSLYETTFWGGREVTITGPASANIPFTPLSLFTTGSTSWTLYSGSDFDGTATCFTPRTDTYYHYINTLNSTLSDVRSILRGCDRHVDYYIYGSSERENTVIGLLKDNFQ